MVSRCDARFNAGSRTGNRDTFATKTIPGFRPSGQPVGCSNSLQTNLCLSKEKYPKTNPPGADLDALGARSASARMARVSRPPHAAFPCAPKALGEGASQPRRKTRGIPAAPLSGKSAQTLRCSARHQGGKLPLYLRIVGCAEQTEAHRSRNPRMT